MNAAATTEQIMQVEQAGLAARFESLQHELDDIKRILVLLQHRSVIFSLLREDQERHSWFRRLLRWLGAGRSKA
jgi:hypothetical protein